MFWVRGEKINIVNKLLWSQIKFNEGETFKHVEVFLKVVLTASPKSWGGGYGIAESLFSVDFYATEFMGLNGSILNKLCVFKWWLYCIFFLLWWIKNTSSRAILNSLIKKFTFGNKLKNWDIVHLDFFFFFLLPNNLCQNGAVLVVCERNIVRIHSLKRNIFFTWELFTSECYFKHIATNQ